jgi:predicted dehydrogenase
MQGNSQSNLDLSRRVFVAGAAALPLAGCAASATKHSSAAQYPLRTTPLGGAAPVLKIGVIGCGGRGTGAAVQALRADPKTVLWAMGDVFADRVEASHAAIAEEMSSEPARVDVPGERRFVGFDSYQRVIDSGVDVVLLTGYPAFRPVQLAAAVASGKHVFAEKPLAVDGPGIRSCIESARRAKEQNLALLVGFCWRHNPGMRGAFDKVLNGGVGDVVSVHTTYHTGTLGKRPRQPGWSDMEFQLRNWWHFSWISGDHIVEQAVHSIDRLAWAMGDAVPASVQCLGGRAARKGEESGDAFDHFAAAYDYADGRRCFHSCRQIDSCPSDNTDYVYGTKGSCEINGWKPTYRVKDRRGKAVWNGAGSAEEASRMYQFEHDALFASIRSGRCVNDGERSANSCLMAIMARMAAYSGQTVTWEQALNSAESLVPADLRFGPAPSVRVAVPGVTKLT